MKGSKLSSTPSVATEATRRLPYADGYIGEVAFPTEDGSIIQKQGPVRVDAITVLPLDRRGLREALPRSRSRTAPVSSRSHQRVRSFQTPGSNSFASKRTHRSGRQSRSGFRISAAALRRVATGTRRCLRSNHAPKRRFGCERSFPTPSSWFRATALKARLQITLLSVSEKTVRRRGELLSQNPLRVSG